MSNFMEGAKETFTMWWRRFKEWMRHEPVRAAEQLRMLLVSTVAALQVTVGDEMLTAIGAVITALVSIWASKRARDTVYAPTTVERDYVLKEEMTEDAEV